MEDENKIFFDFEICNSEIAPEIWKAFDDFSDHSLFQNTTIFDQGQTIAN